MRSASSKNKEDENVKVDTKFGLFREHEIDDKLREAKKDAPPKIEKDGEQIDTTVKIEKIEATKGSHAIRWLEQEGQKRVFVKEFVYEPNRKTGNKFLIKMFLILLAMLIITAGLNVAIKIEFKHISVFGESIYTVLYSVLALMSVNYFWTCSTWSRKKPHNIIGLVLGVPAMTCLIAAIAAYWDIFFILLLVILGKIVAVVLCIFLSTTNYDFTSWFLYVMVVPLTAGAVFLMTIFSAIFGTLSMKNLLIQLSSSIAVLVLLIAELHLMLSGRYVEVLEDDYAFAAWLLYVSTFAIFLKLVQMFDLIDTD